MTKNLTKHHADRATVRVHHAPGIQCDFCEKEPYVYKTVFFGGTREYVDENDGWTYVTNKRKRGWKGRTEVEDEDE
jgi:hypothetical protein